MRVLDRLPSVDSSNKRATIRRPRRRSAGHRVHVRPPESPPESVTPFRRSWQHLDVSIFDEDIMDKILL
jgi:hypothetical protein